MNFTQITQQGEDGNTDILTCSEETKHGRNRNFVFTWNNYTDQDIYFIQNVKGVKAYIFQEETGEKTGTPHLQGYIEFENTKTLSALKKSFGDGPHFEVSRNRIGSIEYCRKEKTRTGKEYRKGFWAPIKVLSEAMLKPWQKAVYDLTRTEPDDRSINWFYDIKGGCGKSALAKFISYHHKDDTLYVSGKAADIKYALATFLEQHGEIRTIIYDITRSQENYFSYQSIEELKNGICFATKYESQQLIFNPPHVIIFANFEPDKSMLSEDRWKIVCLDI